MWPGGVHEGSSRSCSDLPARAHSSLHPRTCADTARGSDVPDRRVSRCSGVEHRQRRRHREAAAGLARPSRACARRRAARLSLRRPGARLERRRVTTPWPSRRPRASSRCSRASRRRCCCAATCCTRCTASARRRRSPGAWSRCASSSSTSGSSAMSLMEQGRLAEAAEAYQKMIDLKPFYQSYTRAAHLRWLKGDLDGAIEMMQRRGQGREPARSASRSPGPTRGWRCTSCSAAGWPTPQRMADASLQYVPDYAAALLARGRIQLAQKQDRRRRRDAGSARRASIRCPNTSGRSPTRCACSNRTDEAAAIEQQLVARRRRRRSAHARALPVDAARGRRQGGRSRQA